MNDQATEDRPDIDTYRHRIGAYLQGIILLIVRNLCGKFSLEGVFASPGIESSPSHGVQQNLSFHITNIWRVLFLTSVFLIIMSLIAL